MNVAMLLILEMEGLLYSIGVHSSTIVDEIYEIWNGGMDCAMMLLRMIVVDASDWYGSRTGGVSGKMNTKSRL
jgi:hypothetical protein